MTQQLGTDAPTGVPGEVTYDDLARTATFTPSPSSPFSGGSQGAVYTLLARGSGVNPTKDLDNLALDGNRDGTARDDFTSRFTVKPSLIG
jgi:hypothetical protein